MASDNLVDERSAAEADVVSIKLPAPAGWTKKFIPKKEGTPGRNEIIFIAPTGEEIKSKTQLKSYVKSHPGGPNVKDFDWTTGDTPRRSARLTEKSKATESPDNDTPKKRQRKLSAMEEAKDGHNEDETADENESPDKIGSIDEEAKAAAEVPAADAEDIGECADKEVVTDVAFPENDDVKASVQISPEGEAVTEEQNSDAQEHEVAAKEQDLAAVVLEAATEELEAALEEQKTPAEELEAALEEQKTPAEELEAALKEQKTPAEEIEAALEEQTTPAEELEAALEEQKAADQNVEAQLGTNDNEAMPLGKEDVQLKPNENKDGDINEDKLASDDKLSYGEEGAENAANPSALAEEANENVPGGDTTISFGSASTGMVVDGVEDLLSTQDNANAEQSADKVKPVDQPKYSTDRKVDSATMVVADKDSLKANEAENQNTAEIDTPMSS